MFLTCVSLTDLDFEGDEGMNLIKKGLTLSKKGLNLNITIILVLTVSIVDRTSGILTLWFILGLNLDKIYLTGFVLVIY